MAMRRTTGGLMGKLPGKGLAGGRVDKPAEHGADLRDMGARRALGGSGIAAPQALVDEAVLLQRLLLPPGDQHEAEAVADQREMERDQRPAERRIAGGRLDPRVEAAVQRRVAQRIVARDGA